MAMNPEVLEALRRHSKLALDREGRWSLNGRPVENARVAELFCKGVAPADGEPGVYTLHVGTQWAYIEHLEDTPFFVARVRLEAKSVRLELLGGMVETLDPGRLWMRGETDLVCWVRGGHRARFLREALAGLGPVVAEVGGRLGLQLGKVFHAFLERPTADR